MQELYYCSSVDFYYCSSVELCLHCVFLSLTLVTLFDYNCCPILRRPSGKRLEVASKSYSPNSSIIVLIHGAAPCKGTLEKGVVLGYIEMFAEGPPTLNTYMNIATATCSYI